LKRLSWALLILLFLCWPLYQALDYIKAQPFATALDLVNFTVSIFTYNWLMLNILLSLKVPVFQRVLPYDVRVQAHILSSVGIAAFVLFHGLYYGLFLKKQITTVTWLLIFLVPHMLILAVLWIPVPGFRKLRDALYARRSFHLIRSYDAFKILHRVLFLALAILTYLHIWDAEIVGVASPASLFGFQALFFFTMAMVLIALIHWATQPRLRVIQASKRGRVTELSLEPSRRLRYRSGQFAFVSLNLPGFRLEEHPFSFTSAESEKLVSFAVKDIGDFSAKVAALKPGDLVRVNGGFGHFLPHGIL
jgi:predicted ferric reductase